MPGETCDLSFFGKIVLLFVKYAICHLELA